MRAFYLNSPRGQVARITYDPRGYCGLSGTGRLTVAFPIGLYRSCAAGWRIARMRIVFQSLRGVRCLPRLSASLERW